MELMISIAASTIIAYVIFVTIRATQDQLNTASVSMTMQTSAREGLYRMIQEIRESAPSRIVITPDGATIDFNVPDPSAPITAGYAVNWPGHTIQYTRGGTNNSQIIRTNATTGQTSVVANDVTGIIFTGNTAEPTVVTVAIDIQRSLPNGRQIPITPMTLTGQARIRNT